MFIYVLVKLAFSICLPQVWVEVNLTSDTNSGREVMNIPWLILIVAFSKQINVVLNEPVVLYLLFRGNWKHISISLGLSPVVIYSVSLFVTLKREVFLESHVRNV